MEEEQELQVQESSEDAEARLRASLEIEYEEKFETRLTSEIQKISQRLVEENKKVVTEAIERYKKELAPPSEQDIQKLLEQEYVEFKIEVPVGVGEGRQIRTFMIRELPQKAEKKIYAAIKKVLIPVSTDLIALTGDVLQGDAAKKLVQLMNTFEPAMDAMVSVAAIALNPYGEEQDIDDEWVRSNLSSTRILKVVTAQVEANKMRDFFSLLSRGMRLVTMD
jgi:hypothetical protein